MIYLASPYSHSDAVVRERRFAAVCSAMVKLIAAGHVVFSPILQGHPLAAHGLRTDRLFCERFDRDLLARCDELVGLMIDGWRESVGVTAETRIAEELGEPVRDLAPDAAGSPTLAHVSTEAVR